MSTAEKNGHATSFLLDEARGALAAGISVVPPAEDGTKRPLGTWKRYMKVPPTDGQLARWYGDRTGIGFVCGSVSGGLECLEFDDLETYRRFKAAAEVVGLAVLVARIEAGYCEVSPGNGVHWFYRVPEARGNTKLAERPEPSEANPHGRKVLIETRGEGGFVVVAPSFGQVHPSGKAYKLMSGGVGSIAELTADERELLWALARSFDEIPETTPPPEQGRGKTPRSGGQGTPPGTDFNHRATWDEILVGWTKVHTRGDVTYWRRPGKAEGWSATTGNCKAEDGTPRLKVFSSSTPFDPHRTYDRFSAYAQLNHGGDLSAAAKALSEAGYGTYVEGGVEKPNPRPRNVPRQPAPLSNGKPPNDRKPPTGTGGPAINDGDLANHPRTEFGLAERFHARFGQAVRYCHSWTKFLVWDGRRWRIDDKARARQLGKRVVRSLYAEAATISDNDDRKSFVRWAMQCESKKSLDAMLNLVTHEDGIPILPDEMDRDPWTLNVDNGILDLRTGRLRPHDPAELLTKLCPVPYRPDARCPTFEAFLRRIFSGQDDLIRFVQALCGHVLTGTVGEQVLPILHGIGANGKSTLVTALLDVLGPDYAMKAPANLLMVRRSEAHPTELADLFGKRLVVASETGEGCRLNETLVKELTGSERIRARRMRQDFWEFSPTHKVLLCTNHKPSIRGTDHAIWRRIRLIPFSVVIPDEEQDRQLDAKLRAELPGILAWCVQGCLAWQRDGLLPPAEVTQATSEYRSEEDILRVFLDEHCVLIAQAKTKASDLYERYKAWAEEAGEHGISSTKFGKALGERGFEKSKSGTIWYTGIGLR